jgi:hypothetical protein
MKFEVFMKQRNWGHIFKRGEIITSKYLPKRYTFVVHRTVGTRGIRIPGYSVSNVETGLWVESGRTKEEAIERALDCCKRKSKSEIIMYVKKGIPIFEEYKKEVDEHLKELQEEERKPND